MVARSPLTQDHNGRAPSPFLSARRHLPPPTIVYTPRVFFLAATKIARRRAFPAYHWNRCGMLSKPPPPEMTYTEWRRRARVLVIVPTTMGERDWRNLFIKG